MRRGLAILAIATAAVFAGAGAAGAATVTKVGTEYRYHEDPSLATANLVNLYFCEGSGCSSVFGDPGGYYLIQDNGIAPTAAAGSGCGTWSINASFTQCPSAGITGWSISLAVGNDTLAVQTCCGAMNVPLVVSGGDGNDSLQGGPLADTLDGGPGTDILWGFAGNDSLDGGTGNDTLNGGDGANDTVSYAGRGEAVTVDLAAPGANDGSQADGNPGSRDTINDVERVIGGNAGDNIDGGTLTSPLTLEGGPGGDRLRGGLGANTLLGGSGNDDLEGRGAADLLDGGDGHDTLDGLGGADEVLGGAGFDTIDARDGVADDVDCGPDSDAAATDSVDTRANCDSPPPAPVVQTVVRTVTVKETVVTPGRVLADLGYVFAAGRKSTVLRSFALETEPGSRVTATCRVKRKRCKRTRTFTRARASRELRLKAFERKKLPVGAKLTIKITKSGMVGAVKTLTIRKRKAPKVTTRCIQPGGTRPSRC